MKNIESSPNKYQQDQARRSWETVKYTDNPELPELEDIKIVKDFLPPPEMLVKRDPETEKEVVPSLHRTIGAEQLQNLREWVAGLPKTGISLPDEAFDRESIYIVTL